MNRLARALKTDATVQVRTNLYTIGVGAGMLVAIVVGSLATREYLPAVMPALMLIVTGGSTLLYVAGLIIFEKEQGTLNANIVSPLRTSEYLWSKIASLTALATLESVVMIGGAMLIMSFSGGMGELPNVPLMLLGIIAIGILYTLVGIVLVVLFNSITDYLVPVAAVAVVLQLPFLYFLGWVKHWALLIIPTSAPTMLMQGAYVPLETWQWLYAVGYTLLGLVALTMWAQSAFYTHVVSKVG